MQLYKIGLQHALTSIFMYRRDLTGTLAVTSSTGKFLTLYHTHTKTHLNAMFYSLWSNRETEEQGGSNFPTGSDS